MTVVRLRPAAQVLRMVVLADMVPGPLAPGQVYPFALRLQDARGLPVHRAGVRVTVEVVSARSGERVPTGTVSVGGAVLVDGRTTLRTDADGVASTSIVATSPLAEPVVVRAVSPRTLAPLVLLWR